MLGRAFTRKQVVECFPDLRYGISGNFHLGVDECHWTFCRDMFLAIDSDGDGLISVEQLCSALHCVDARSCIAGTGRCRCYSNLPMWGMEHDYLDFYAFVRWWAALGRGDTVDSAVLAATLKSEEGLADVDAGISLTDEEVLALAKEVFSRLDQGNKGYLTLDDVVVGITKCVYEAVGGGASTLDTSAHDFPDEMWKEVKYLASLIIRESGRVVLVGLPDGACAQGRPLIITLPVFLRTYQRNTGIFPPQWLSLCAKELGSDDREDVSAHPARRLDFVSEAPPATSLDQGTNHSSLGKISPFELSYLLTCLTAYADELWSIECSKEHHSRNRGLSLCSWNREISLPTTHESVDSATATMMELEARLRVDLMPIYHERDDHRELVVRQVRIIASATAHARELTPASKWLVNLDQLVQSVAEEPALLGLQILPLKERISCCLKYAMSMPRQSIVGLVQLLIEEDLHRPHRPGTAIMDTLVRLRQRLPWCVNSGEPLEKLSDLAHHVTNAAEICAGGCGLSLHSLTAELVRDHFALPPPLQPYEASSGPGAMARVHQRALCRRLSNREQSELLQGLQGLDTASLRRLLIPDEARRSWSVSRESHNFIVDHLVYRTSTCATRHWIASHVAAHLLSDIEQQLHVQSWDTAEEHLSGGAESIWAETVELAIQNCCNHTCLNWTPRANLAQRKQKDELATWAVRQAFAFFGCSARFIGAALCQVEASCKTVVGRPELGNGVFLEQQLMCDAVEPSMRLQRKEWTVEEAHHAVWDIVGSCPLASDSGDLFSPSSVGMGYHPVWLDCTALLCSLLRAFPLLSPARVPVVHYCFPIEDAAAVSMALAHLTATVDGGASPSGSGTPSPSCSNVSAHHLRELLGKDTLFYVLCSLSAQHAVTGDVLSLHNTLSCLTLSEYGVRVQVHKLSNEVMVNQLDTKNGVGNNRPSTGAILDSEPRTIMRQNKAVAMALPVQVQHAMAHLFTLADERKSGQVTRPQMESLVEPSSALFVKKLLGSISASRDLGALPSPCRWWHMFLDACFAVCHTDGESEAAGALTLEKLLLVTLQESSRAATAILQHPPPASAVPERDYLHFFDALCSCLSTLPRDTDPFCLGLANGAP